MTCPKCGGRSIFDAMGEAPDHVDEWKKCMSCGTRFDPTGRKMLGRGPAPESRAVERFGDDEDADAGQDLLGAALERDPEDESFLDESGEADRSEVDRPARRGRRAQKPTEPKKEVVMGAWSPEARARHAARMREAWDARRARGGEGGKGKKFANPAHREAVKAAAVLSKKLRGKEVEVPAVIEPGASIAVTVGSMPVLSLLDRMIVEAAADVQALERVREIMARGGQ